MGNSPRDLGECFMSLLLGINSYGSDFSGDDGEGLMLAWTSDEQSQLDIDLHGLLTTTLAAEVSKGAALLRRYAVDDPYGAGVMRPALRVLFNTDFQSEQIVCAAGVVGLLHGLANLTKGDYAIQTMFISICPHGHVTGASALHRYLAYKIV